MNTPVTGNCLDIRKSFQRILFEYGEFDSEDEDFISIKDSVIENSKKFIAALENYLKDVVLVLPSIWVDFDGEFTFTWIDTLYILVVTVTPIKFVWSFERLDVKGFNPVTGFIFVDFIFDSELLKFIKQNFLR